jgi:hypothetical protein
MGFNYLPRSFQLFPEISGFKSVEFLLASKWSENVLIKSHKLCWRCSASQKQERKKSFRVGNQMSRGIEWAKEISSLLCREVSINMIAERILHKNMSGSQTYVVLVLAKPKTDP